MQSTPPRAPRLSDAELAVLVDRIATAAVHIDAALHRLLTDIRAFDVAAGWHEQGARSCAHWLSWRIGLSLPTAREHVRVARRLGELPRLDTAFARGEISYSKVRAITRVATADNEELLIRYARSAPAAQLERVCRLYRQVAGALDASAEARDERRWLRVRGTDDDMVRIDVQLHAEDAELLLAAIDGAAQRVSAEAPHRVDGLMALAHAATRGESDKVPAEVVVHVDADTFEGHLDASGAGVSTDTAERLACDAGIVTLVEDSRGEPLSVGRKTRSIPAAIRRALGARDQGCRFPGCAHTRYLHGHHIEHWRHGGATELRNLCLLCSQHHRLVHEGGFTVTPTAGGALEFRDPDGRVVVAQAPRPRLAAADPMSWLAHAHGHTVDARTALPDWDGDPPDYAVAVDALLHADGLT